MRTTTNTGKNQKKISKEVRDEIVEAFQTVGFSLKTLFMAS